MTSGSTQARAQPWSPPQNGKRTHECVRLPPRKGNAVDCGEVDPRPMNVPFDMPRLTHP
jgi:hypothetical protein